MEHYDSPFWKLIDHSFPQDWQAAAEEWARRIEGDTVEHTLRCRCDMGFRPVEGGYVAPDDDDGA